MTTSGAANVARRDERYAGRIHLRATTASTKK